MRYKNQNIFKNIKEQYRRYFKKTRGIESIRQYNTPRFKHPSVDDMRNFNTIKHVWRSNDRLYKLAHEYYEDSEMWWVIALYNQKPTEFHFKEGDVVYIPVPLETILFYIGY